MWVCDASQISLLANSYSMKTLCLLVFFASSLILGIPLHPFHRLFLPPNMHWLSDEIPSWNLSFWRNWFPQLRKKQREFSEIQETKSRTFTPPPKKSVAYPNFLFIKAFLSVKQIFLTAVSDLIDLSFFSTTARKSVFLKCIFHIMAQLLLYIELPFWYIKMKKRISPPLNLKKKTLVIISKICL